MQQTVLPLDVSYDGSVLKQPMLPGRFFSKAACATFGRVFLQQLKLPLHVSVLLFYSRPVLPLSVFVLYCSYVTISSQQHINIKEAYLTLSVILRLTLFICSRIFP